MQTKPTLRNIQKNSVKIKKLQVVVHTDVAFRAHVTLREKLLSDRTEFPCCSRTFCQGRKMIEILRFRLAMFEVGVELNLVLVRKADQRFCIIRL